jgi:hypothetical protein
MKRLLIVGVFLAGLVTAALAQSPLPAFVYGNDHTFGIPVDEHPVAATFDAANDVLYVVFWNPVQSRVRIKELRRDTGSGPTPPVAPTQPCVPSFPSPVPGWVPTSDCLGWVPPS